MPASKRTLPRILPCALLLLAGAAADLRQDVRVRQAYLGR